jgi:hypothetical protein
VRTPKDLELSEHAVMQMTPLTHGFALVVALLPTVQTVFARALLLLRESIFPVRCIFGLQAALEGVEHLRNVVVELRARKTRRGSQLRIQFHCVLPTAQDIAAPRREMLGQGGKFGFDLIEIAHRRTSPLCVYF